jgi:hypothetical protein
MGDYPLAKNQQDIDCIYFILQALHHHKELVDEIYCQLMKQTTNNKSTKAESCQKGWRLMAIMCAYYKTSDTLKPYLFKYLENNAYDTKRPNYGMFTIRFLLYYKKEINLIVIATFNLLKPSLKYALLACARRSNMAAGEMCRVKLNWTP